MKTRILLILRLLVKCISYIYSYSLARKLKIIRDICYTYWITSKFKYFGKSIFIYPVTTILGEKYISIGDNSTFGARTVLTTWDKYYNDTFTPQIVIGNNVNIGEDCHITAINRIKIGDDVLMGKKITISDNSHGISSIESMTIAPIKRKLFSKGPVIIESKAWIGDKATILAGVRIGESAIVGANTVVTKDVPAYSVVVGNPAKIIKIIEII